MASGQTVVSMVDFPGDRLVSHSLPRVDYADAFCATLPAAVAADPVRLVRAFFHSFPRWVNALMHVRAVVARVLRLKHPSREDARRELAAFTGRVGESIALFQVLAADDNEVVTGQPDQHLDFRLAFIRQQRAESTEVTLVTTVQFNHWTGRLYFMPVRILHRLIVPAVLRRMVALLQLPSEEWPEV